MLLFAPIKVELSRDNISWSFNVRSPNFYYLSITWLITSYSFSAQLIFSIFHSFEIRMLLLTQFSTLNDEECFIYEK